MRIAIVEDDPREREALAALLARYREERGLEAEVRAHDSGESFLSDPDGADLALLDIEMSGLSGLEAARRLREEGRDTELIFVTHLVQYAIEGYSVDAVDFIAKPARYPALCAAMDRALARLRARTPRFLMTRYAKEPVSCQAQQIVFIESLNKRTLIHMAGGETLRSSEPLYALEEKLAGEDFFRCHNAYLVNLRHVYTVGTAELTAGAWQLPVSKYRKREFLQRLAACRGRML